MKKSFTYILFFIPVLLFCQAPANDNICNAISMTAGLSCTQGTNVSATSTGTPATPSCWGSQSNDVWYSFVATSSAMTISTDVTGTTLTDSQIAVYSSSNNTCSGTLTQVGCDDDGGGNCNLCSVSSLSNLTVGNTYFIRIDGFGTATGTFCISAYDTYIVGSTPCEAQQVYPNNGGCTVSAGTTAYNTTLNWTTTVGANYCGCDVETGQQGSWSTFTANSASTTITNGTGGANAITHEYTIFTGSCSALSCVNCYSVAKGSSTSFPTTVGTTYYVLTTTSGSSASEIVTDHCITSTVTCTPPANDNCTNAISISANTTYTANTLCATADDALCSGSMENNIWYSWTVPATWTGNAYFQMFNQNCSGGDLSGGQQVSVYSANQTCSGTTSCATFSNVGDDINVNMYWTPTPGATYLITFDGFGGEVCLLNFQITNTAIILPIELMSFNATPEYRRVKLDWSTAAEKNNAYFTLERSVDGINFQSIGVVNGQGISYVKHDYVFYDEHPLEGISYYRLKQTDDNHQSSTYSEIKMVKFDPHYTPLSVYPNPSAAELFVNYTSFTNETVSLKVTDLNGKTVYSEQMSCQNGANTLKLDVSAIPAGVYLVSVVNGNGTVNSRFIRSKSE